MNYAVRTQSRANGFGSFEVDIGASGAVYSGYRGHSVNPVFPEGTYFGGFGVWITMGIPAPIAMLRAPGPVPRRPHADPHRRFPWAFQAQPRQLSRQPAARVASQPCPSYCEVHTEGMAARRTISLPPALDGWLQQTATRRGISVSALIVELLDPHARELPYAGLIDDDDDLSLRVEEILARMAA